jgi:hypothetical protein
MLDIGVTGGSVERLAARQKAGKEIQSAVGEYR